MSWIEDVNFDLFILNCEKEKKGLFKLWSTDKPADLIL